MRKAKKNINSYSWIAKKNFEKNDNLRDNDLSLYEYYSFLSLLH